MKVKKENDVTKNVDLNIKERNIWSTLNNQSPLDHHDS